MPTGRKLLIAGIVVVMVVIAGGIGGYLYLFGDDAPTDVSLEDAVAGVESDITTGSTTPDSGTSTPEGIAGVWNVDASVGDFDYSDSASATFVGFRVAEELITGDTEAVGRTPVVDGAITIDGTTLTQASINADLSKLTTDVGARDGATHRALGTDQFPTATFALTSPVDLGAGAGNGEAVSVTASGNLTVKGVTKSVEVSLEAQLTGSTIVVVGQIPVTFTDYGVDLPSSPRVVSIEDHGTIEILLHLTR